MPLLDFFQHFMDKGNTSPNVMSTIKNAGRVAETLETFSNDYAKILLVNVILPWAHAVALKAPTKWILPASGPNACQFEGKCNNQAVSICHLCGRPVCLGHAVVGVDATIVCWQCMRTAAQHAKPWTPPKAQSTPGSDAEVALAYRILGVKEDCTEAELKKAYKRLVARYHPDRTQGKDPEGSKSDGELLKALQQAYNLVLQSREGKK